MAGTNTIQKQSIMDSAENKNYLLRSPSTSSDVTVRSTTLTTPHVAPAPAYVARNGAMELIASEIERSVLISTSALVLVNEFLDQVLYSLLLTSRSMSLSSLKAAVPTTLKPRLGKAALQAAEAELQEYLNDDEETEFHTRTNTTELRHDFDPELAWKLARLRCMVYTRLGDLEEEDEAEWLEKEGLLDQLESARQNEQGSIETGPASAIFLTSILEYLGEQALYYAAQHAQKRHYQHGNQHICDEEPDFAELSPDSDELVVGGKDMNHIGRDSPLSRLWRSYRRNNRESASRPMSPEMRAPRGLGLSHSRAPSSVPHETVIFEERSPDQVPLPMSMNDINEIEVPGLAPGFSDDEDEAEQEVTSELRRPASMINMPVVFSGRISLDEHDPPEIPERHPLRPIWLRNRSISTPVPTLAKITFSGGYLSTRPEPVTRDTDPGSMGRLRTGAEADRPDLSRGHDSSESGEASFGGAVDAVAGALGAGALGLSTPAEGNRGLSATNGKMNADEIRMSEEAALPRRTAAEEMLGPKTSTAPPSDATTGASIVNMSDFQNMYVPVEMSSSPSVDQISPATPKASRKSGYFPAQSMGTEDLTPRAEKTNPLSMSGIVPESAENLQPAPLRTMSGRRTTGRPSSAGGSQELPPNDTQTAADSQSTNLDVEHAGFAASNGFSTKNAAASVITSSGLPVGSRVLPKESSQGRLISADALGLEGTSHSRNSSVSSRLFGIVKDVNNRSQVTSQVPVPGIANEEARKTNSPSALNIIRDMRPSTGSSSVSKRFHGKPLQIGDESDEAKKKSLEVLIRGNETLHYTLTPAAALRDEPSTAFRLRTPNQDMAEFLRNTGPREDLTAGTQPSAQGESLPEPPSSPRRLIQRIVSTSSPKGLVNPASPTRGRNSLGEPRDARAEITTSTRDLADYARSTGPSDSKQLPSALGPNSAKSTTYRSAATTPHLETPRSETASPTVPRSANRLKHQARDARTARDEDTSDLIDFIREGPQNPGREHRIDRKVAPFRTTMDSEDFDNLTQGRGIAASLRDSEDEHPASSVDPSVSSQTPLIVSNGRNSKMAIAALPVRQQNGDSDGMPKKTRRRIKDPYAIYDSDDDDLDDELGTKDARNQEESLIDFLRNTAPPPGKMASPILGHGAVSRTTDQFSASGARARSPHLTQSGSKMDKYRPTQPTHAAHIDRNRGAQSSPAVTTTRAGPKPKFEARDARATRTDTAELAEYLKHSGPPPSAQHQPQPFLLSSTPTPPTKTKPPVKEDKGLFKRFSKIRR